MVNLNLKNIIAFRHGILRCKLNEILLNNDLAFEGGMPFKHFWNLIFSLGRIESAVKKQDKPSPERLIGERCHANAI